jgi:N-terminal domain on NACHT_NTPase and P-loop NTPases
MDPFSALTVASCVVQFVDFSSKLVAGFRELYRSAGALAENVDLEEVTEDLSNLSEKLTTAAHPRTYTNSTSKDELALQKLAGSCKEVANELLSLLQDLKVQGTHQKWQSFRQALRSIHKKDKIEYFKNRLEKLQNQLNSRLLAIMRFLPTPSHIRPC